MLVVNVSSLGLLADDVPGDIHADAVFRLLGPLREHWELGMGVPVNTPNRVLGWAPVVHDGAREVGLDQKIPVVDRRPWLGQDLAAAQSRAVASVVNLLREEKVELVVFGHGDALSDVEHAAGELRRGLGVLPVPA